MRDHRESTLNQNQRSLVNLDGVVARCGEVLEEVDAMSDKEIAAEPYTCLLAEPRQTT